MPTKQPIYVIGENLTVEELRTELSRCIEAGEVCGLDCETDGIDPSSDAAARPGLGEIACWSLSTPNYEKVFLWDYHLPLLADLLEYLPVVGHNIFSFDFHMFRKAGVVLRNIVADTLRMSRLIYSCKSRSHGLKPLALYQLGIKQPAFDDLFKRPKHTVELTWVKKTTKGKIRYVDYRETKRKVGDQKGVPTLIVSGELGKFGKATEYIPLRTIPIDYPNRLQALYEYASADAYLTRMLFFKFKQQLQDKELVIAR